ncbi:hypothetical protein [endosymbiont GvMRE of Glomus versiforme]|uniref:hypothetical protein n=1 Tax=endosymbiont GvMRE of Glomus versiforme TaxID=2039283 RepID=UPI000EDE1720|nr:hypothetical protein [endosymbiont GvMRE of Glomus versiforme]RHZ36132.1 hypothetical protein GvMRE_Ic2g113 [endosymbiont GvMRE of Glomus versiforme]
MTELRKVNNAELLQELKYRVEKGKLGKEEVFVTLESPENFELITEYKATDLSKLTKEDWKKACKALEKDEVYQKEVELWDNIDDE